LSHVNARVHRHRWDDACKRQSDAVITPEKHQKDNKATSRQRCGLQHFQDRGNTVTARSDFFLKKFKNLEEFKDDIIVPCLKDMASFVQQTRHKASVIGRQTTENNFDPNVLATNVPIKFPRAALVEVSQQKKREDVSRNTRERD